MCALFENLRAPSYFFAIREAAFNILDFTPLFLVMPSAIEKTVASTLAVGGDSKSS